MSSNEPTQNADPQPTAAPSDESAPKSTSIPPTEASAGSSAEATEAHAHEGGEGGEDEAAEPGETAEAGQAAEGTPAPGATAEGGPKKKRRRRKKKKGGPGGEVAAGGEGGQPQQQQGQQQQGQQQQRRKERRPRPEGEAPRERPAFGVGDVVFGKIIEMTDEALFIDLSGKGHAIFDRHELLLPEEPAQGPGSDLHEDDFDPGDLVAHEEGAPAEAAATPLAPEAAAEPTAEGEPAKERRIITVKEEPAPQEPTPTQASPSEPEPPKAEEHKRESVSLADAPIVVTLPPVVLEVGANFVGVVHNDGGRGGLVVLTRHPRRGRAHKMEVAKALREKTTVKGLVTGVIKGGIEVDIEGLRAFAPASHVALHHGARLHELIGQRLPFFVTQYAKRGTDIVLSRKAMLESEAREKRDEALKHLVVGTAIVGTVRSVVPFGAFIDIGGIEGLVPLAEMSHNRGDSPSDVFHVNQEVEVLLQRIDVKGKIWLSRKAVLPDPWAEVAKKYAEGTRHKGRVMRLQPFGAFVELEPGIDGLIHTSDLLDQRREAHREARRRREGRRRARGLRRVARRGLAQNRVEPGSAGLARGAAVHARRDPPRGEGAHHGLRSERALRADPRGDGPSVARIHHRGGHGHTARHRSTQGVRDELGARREGDRDGPASQRGEALDQGARGGHRAERVQELQAAGEDRGEVRDAR